MRSIQNPGRLVGAMSTGVLMCALVVGCGKREQASTSSNGNTATNSVPAESTQAGSLGGSVAVAPAIQQPAPTSRSSLGGTVAATRTTRRRSTTSTAASTATSPATPLSATPAAAPVSDPNFLAEPQIFTVVLLANIGDSTTSARAVCLPAAGSNDQVRAFAQQMVRDHAALQQRVVNMQHAKSVIPTRSDVSDGVFSANSDAMGSNESARGYVDREVRAHQALLNTLDTKLIPNARDTSLRIMLSDARQVVQGHLAAAQQLQNTLSGQTASLNSPTPAPGQSLSASVTATPAPGQSSSSMSVTAPPAPGQSSTMTVTANPAPGYSANANPPATPPATRDSISSTPKPLPSVTATSTTTASPCDSRTSSQPMPGMNMQLAPTNTPLRADSVRGYDSRVGADTLRARPAQPDTNKVRP